MKRNQSNALRTSQRCFAPFSVDEQRAVLACRVGRLLRSTRFTISQRVIDI